VRHRVPELADRQARVVLDATDVEVVAASDLQLLLVGGRVGGKLHGDEDVRLTIEFSAQSKEDHDGKSTAAEEALASGWGGKAVAEVGVDARPQQEVGNVLGLVVVLGQDNGKRQEDGVVVELPKDGEHGKVEADLVGLRKVERGVRELLDGPRVARPRLFVSVASVEDGVIEVPELLFDDKLPNGGRSDGHDEDFVGVLTLQKLLENFLLVLGEGVGVIVGQ